MRGIYALAVDGTTATVAVPLAAGEQQPYRAGDRVRIMGWTDNRCNGLHTLDAAWVSGDYVVFTYTLQGAEQPVAAGELLVFSSRTQYAYDDAGNLTSLTDSEDNVTSYGYDALNRLIRDTNALDDSRLYTYDAVGNQVTMTSRDNQTRRFTYDALDRQTAEEWLYIDGSSVRRTISSQYDVQGRLLSLSDENWVSSFTSAYSYSYDDLDRVTGIDNVGTDDVPRVILTQGYDAAGNRTSLDVDVVGGTDFGNAYTYDALGRMTRQTQSGTGVAAKRVDYTYTLSGGYDQVVRYSDLNGTSEVVTSTYSYDGMDRLKGLLHRHGSTDLAEYALAYNAASWVTSLTIGNNPSISYLYDDLGQMIDDGSSYSYDTAGNRTMSGYATGSDNRMSAGAGSSYTYDNEGNWATKTTGGSTVTYNFDRVNRLTDAGSFHYTHDAVGRRIGGDDEWYVYDGQDLLAVFDENGGLVNRYLQGPAGQALAQETAGGTVTWMLGDHQGSVRDVAANTGSLVSGSHVAYGSFGQATSGTVGRFGFQGMMWDADSGMYHAQAREYDPQTGRFISQDPSGFSGGQDANLYRFVFNSPLTYTDPTGLGAISSGTSLNLFGGSGPNSSGTQASLASSAGFSGGGQMLFGFAMPDLTFTTRAQIGGVYTFSDSNQVYVGEAANLVKRLWYDTKPGSLNPSQHGRAEFIRSLDSAGEVRPVTVSYNSLEGMSDVTRDRVLMSQESSRFGDIRNIARSTNQQILNDPTKIMRLDKARLIAGQYGAAMGDPIQIKNAGSALERTPLAKFDRGTVRIPYAGTVTNAAGAIGTAVQIYQVLNPAPQFHQGTWYFNDSGGRYHIEEPGLLRALFTSATPRKVYDSGPEWDAWNAKFPAHLHVKVTQPLSQKELDAAGKQIRDAERLMQQRFGNPTERRFWFENLDGVSVYRRNIS